MKIMARKWWLFGFFWGIFMFVFQEVFMPMADDELLLPVDLFKGLFYWVVAGLFLGWIMDKIIERKPVVK